MPVDINKRLIHAFVLLERQFFITEYVVRKRKPRVLASFEKAINENKQSIKDVFRVYELTFSIIDNIVRYEKVASVLPRFSQKSDEFKLFSLRLKGMKELRNLLQHINMDLDTEFVSPILGGITWSKNNVSYMAAFNDLGNKRSLPGLVYDTQEDKYIKEFCYVHNDKYYDLSTAIKGYRGYQKYVGEWCQISLGGSKYMVDDHFIAIATTFHIPKIATQCAPTDDKCGLGKTGDRPQ